MSNLNYNRCIIAGRMCSAPELKQTQNGISFTSFRVAVKRKNDVSDFIQITAWRETAEFIAKYFAVGHAILIEGALTTREYTTKDGEKRTAYEVVADKAFFVDSKNEPKSGENKQTAHFEPISDEEDLPF